MSISVSTTRTVDLSAMTLSAGVTHYADSDLATHGTGDDAAWAPHLAFNTASATRTATGSETWTTSIASLQLTVNMIKGSRTMYYWNGSSASTYSLELPDSGENVVFEAAYGPGFSTWFQVGATITPAATSNSAYTAVTLSHTFTLDTDFKIRVRQTSNSGAPYDHFAMKDIQIVPLGGVTLSKSVATVDEAGTTDTFTAVLDVQPASDVVLDVSSGDTGEATVSPAQLTFTNANWDTPQTVTITGVDDAIQDGDIDTTITVAVNDGSSDAAYATVPDETLVVTTYDNDVTMSTSTVTFVEDDASKNFTVVLNSQPSSDVTFDLSLSHPHLSLTPSSVTFTNANWDTPQTVTVATDMTRPERYTMFDLQALRSTTASGTLAFSSGLARYSATSHGFTVARPVHADILDFTRWWAQNE